MRSILVSIFFIVGSTFSFGQGANVTSWMMNNNGHQAQYYDEFFNIVNLNDSSDILKVCYNTDTIWVRCHSLASFIMGPWDNDPFVAGSQDFRYIFPRNPTYPSTTHDDSPVSLVGLAVNGVAIYAAGDGKSYNSSTNTNGNNGDGLWNQVAWEAHANEMDANGGGHPDPNQVYHNHSNLTGLYDNNNTGVHSPIIGWAFDGWPIYGPFGYSSAMDATSAVVRMEGSYQLRNITTRTTLPDGSTSTPAGPNVSATFYLGLYIEDYEYVSGLGDLDEYNGRYCVTPEYPSGTYAYFLNTDSNGDPVYPNLIAEKYYGEFFPAIQGPNGGDADGIYNATCIEPTQTGVCSATVSSSTNVTCFGSSNGSATVTTTGLTSPTYSWVNSSSVEVSTSATASGLSAGAYTVTATDGTCTATASVTLTQPTAISITNTTTNVVCNGGSTGAINVEVSGGTPNGSASPGLLISEVAADPAGTDSPFEFVELIATKAIDFTTDPYTIVFTNNGTATANGWVHGAALSYAFEISTGSVNVGDIVYVGGSSMIPVTNILRSINTGTTAGDGFGNSNTNGVLGNGGTSADAVGVFASDASLITSSTVPVDAIFFGSAMGTAVVSSGTAGYQLPVNDKYTGGKLQTTSFLAPNAASGNYLKATGTYNLQTNTYTTPRTWANTTTFTNGTSSVSLTNPYTYSWSNGATTQDVNGITAGTYTVTVTDGGSCTSSQAINVTQPTAISLSSTTTSASCSTNNGSINLTVSGGSGTYTYLWSNGATTQDISSLAAGNYSVTVTDANNCTATSTVTVGSTSGLTLSTTATHVQCNGGSTGAVNLTVAGGTPGYTFLWSNSATSEDISSLAAGTYSVTVTDNGGCTASASTTITQPSALSASAVATAVSCNGGTTGSVNLTVSGGTSGYTYLWSNSSTTEDISGVAAGIYSVTVTDANACTATASATVTQPTALSLSTVNTDVTCNGAGTGAVNLTVSGGTSGYTYLWSNSATTQDISSITSGTYTVTVTDANACTASTSATITQPTVISLSSTTTSASCSSNNGSINLSVTGGTGAYTYAWSNGATTQNISSLAAGSYSVTVTDANSCTATSTITVSSTSGLALGTSSSNVTCNGASTGAVNLTVSGGTPGYTYLWSNSATSEDISSLAAGTYSVTVTDNGGCTATTSVTITQPSVLTASAVATAVTCNGGANGSVDVTVTGGTSAYSYNWSNSAVTEDILSLSAGTYSVTVSDANGCSATASATVTQPTAITLSATPENVLCFGNSTGAVNLTATGGTGSYTYDWSNTATSEDISSLAAGTYSVTVVDANGCSATTSATVSQPVAISLSTIVTDVTTCNGANGAIDLMVTGGTAAYSFAWSNAATSEDITGLSGGNYIITVTDANNCTAVQTVVVNEPAGFTLSSVSTPVDCNGENSGSINLTVTGGTLPLTYAWDSGQTTEDISLLTAGTYEVTVTDNAGCTDVLTVTVTEPTVMNLSVTTTDEISGNDGSVNLTVTGGTPGYTYSWTGGQTTQDINGLVAGSYTVTVTDANGCTETITATVGSQIGIEEILGIASVKLYPNPATDIVNVEAIATPAFIKIYSTEGKLVLMTSNSSTINIYELQRGIYIAELMVNGTIVKQKLVKQ